MFGRQAYHRTITDGLSTGADWESAWIDCRGWRRVTFCVRWGTGVASLAGVLYLQGRMIYEPEGGAGLTGTDTDLDSITLDSGTYGAWPNVTQTTSPAICVVENPLPFHNVRFDHTAGAAGGEMIVIVDRMRW